jgi:phosphoribosylaminoimidazole-succinocarboxamide synthase
MKKAEKIDIGILSREPDIKGSVQDLYHLQIGSGEYMLCRTSESGSVFDVGTIFSVPQSDVLRTVVRHAIYSGLENPDTWKQLTDADLGACYKDPRIRAGFLPPELLDRFRAEGVRTHHVGMVDDRSGEVHSREFPAPPSNLVLIERFPVYRPGRQELGGKFAWDYRDYLLAGKKVVALENVFRLGVPGGSSLVSRYQAGLAEGGPSARAKVLASLGLSEEPKPWAGLPDMIFDTSTKYEPQDRYLSWQETVMLSGLSWGRFQRLVQTIAYCTVWVNKFFRDMGFQLWDIKWEVAVDADRIVVVDTVDPDSIRLTGRCQYQGRPCFVHFNKQAIRDYYKIIHAQWYRTINEAKALAETDAAGRDFMEIYRKGVAESKYPAIPQADPDFSQIQSDKYQVMGDYLLKRETVAGVRRRADELMAREIDFYQRSGLLDQFLRLNSAPA